MYIDLKSCYSIYALVLPSRCAEAAKLSRLGHNRERAGRGVHPPSGVIGTQRNDRRHVRCIRRTESFDRSRDCFRTSTLPQGRTVPYERMRRILDCSSSLGSKRVRSECRSNLHGQRQKRRIDANQSNANRKKRNVENGMIPVKRNTLHIGWYAPEGFDRRGRTVSHAGWPPP